MVAEPGPAFLERVAFELAAVPESIGEARHRIAKTVRGRLRRGDLSRVELLVSEIVTNSIRHGGRRLEIVVIVRESAVRVEVDDDGAGFAAQPQPPAPDGEGGWGLFLVERMADAWGVDDGERTRVWFEVSAAKGSQPGRGGTA